MKFIYPLCIAIGLAALTGQAGAVSINIPSQSLTGALELFAQQSGLEVVVYSDVATGITAPEVSGDLTANAALERLLVGTELKYEYLDARTIAVVSKVGLGQTSMLGAVAGTERMARLGAASASAGEGPGEDGKNASSSSPEGEKSTVQEIIVTAQKRQERLQDVPISISVLSGGQLDRSTDQGLTDALNRVPGVAATGGGFGTTLAVRGVTAAANAFAGASPTAYYLDSVPFGLGKTATVPDANVYDLERVEVLRGPQGTLYGASALNGVIRVLTQDPNLNEFGIKMRASTSATAHGGENYRGDAAVNVPIVEGKLAVRAVAGYQDVAGWIDSPNKKDVNDGEIRTARVKVAAQPTDGLSIVASAWLSRTDYDGLTNTPDGYTTPRLFDQPNSTDYDVYGLKIGYDFSGFSVTSATGYLDFANDSVIDNVSIPGFATTLSNFSASVFSQELNLTSTHDGAWRWTLGGIYRHAKDGIWQNIPRSASFAGIPNPTANSRDSESVAVFGELTRLFLDGRWELTGGLRHFEDKVASSEDSNITGAPPRGVYIHAKFDKVTPRAVLTWHPSERMSAYASYSEGFRSGFSQNPVVAALGFPDVRPDTLKNYELGAKGGAWDGRLTVETALFYEDWRDVQQNLQVFLPAANTFVAGGVNGISASGMGFEFATTAELTRGLTLGANFGWNDLAIDADVLTFSSAAPQGIRVFPKGSRLNNSPKYTAGGWAASEFPLGDSGFGGRFSVSVNYTSPQQGRLLQGVNVFTDLGDPMKTASASFSIDSRDKRWSATLFADNLTNEKGAVIDGKAVAATQDLDLRQRPRTIGVQFEYRP